MQRHVSTKHPRCNRLEGPNDKLTQCPAPPPHDTLAPVSYTGPWQQGTILLSINFNEGYQPTRAQHIPATSVLLPSFSI